MKICFISWTLWKGLGDQGGSLGYTLRSSSLEITWLHSLMANLIKYLLTFLKSYEKIVSGNLLAYSGVLGIFILVKFQLSNILVENWPCGWENICWETHWRNRLPAAVWSFLLAVWAFYVYVWIILYNWTFDGFLLYQCFCVW